MEKDKFNKFLEFFMISSNLDCDKFNKALEEFDDNEIKSVSDFVCAIKAISTLKRSSAGVVREMLSDAIPYLYGLHVEFMSEAEVLEFSCGVIESLL